MEEIFNLLLNSFDFGFMLSVNVLTYLIIKIIDELNGEKIVPVWLKRLVALACGLVVGGLISHFFGFSTTLIYSFILSLISWDIIFKPILNKFNKINYKKKDDNGCNI